MRSKIGRVALGIAAVAAAVILFVVLQDGDGTDAPSEAGGAPAAGGGAQRPTGKDDGDAGPGEPAIRTIVVRDGRPVGGVQELTFKSGEQVRFEVRSDTADELHVHGYDVERELPAGRAVRVSFPATIEGVFEAELHESGEQVAELRVEP